MTTSTSRGRAVRAMLAGAALGALSLWSVPATPAAATVRSDDVPSHGLRLEAAKKAKRAKRPAKKQPKPAAKPAAQPASASGSYTFMNRRSDGSPVRYNPCSAIGYVVNADRAPAGGLADVHAAFERLAAVTGMQFVYEGTTDEIATGDRGTKPNPRYAGRFEPVLVGFHKAGESPLLHGHQLGVGGSIWYENAARQQVYVTGVVAIDADLVARHPTGFGSARSLGVVVLHELGHVLGLGHAHSTAEVMYAERVDHGATALGPGDKTGLAQLGARSGCQQSPAYPF